MNAITDFLKVKRYVSLQKVSADICVVCNKEITALMQSFCGACGKVFHLNQRKDMSVKECGEVWLDEERMGLMFRCENCIQDEDKGGHK